MYIKCEKCTHLYIRHTHTLCRVLINAYFTLSKIAGNSNKILLYMLNYDDPVKFDKQITNVDQTE